MTIETTRLRLRLNSREGLLAKYEGMAEVSPDWIARIRAATAPDPWNFGFEIVLTQDGTAIGDAGFKGPPDDEGSVEIAYGIDPAYEGRGYATEAADGLVNFASRDSRVRVIRAHTLPTGGASMRVLEKCGFAFVGEVVDPEDGLVRRYERKPAAPAK
jgi:RimJ/RimL family protein N-acetyltransferase